MKFFLFTLLLTVTVLCSIEKEILGLSTIITVKVPLLLKVKCSIRYSQLDTYKGGRFLGVPRFDLLRKFKQIVVHFFICASLERVEIVQVVSDVFAHLQVVWHVLVLFNFTSYVCDHPPLEMRKIKELQVKESNSIP